MGVKYRGEDVNYKLLKSIREERHLSQKQFCLKCGIPITTYQRIEYGKREGTISLWNKIAKYYGVTLAYFIVSDTKINAAM